MLGPLKVAASSTTSVVGLVDFGVDRPEDAGDDQGALSVGDDQVVGLQDAVDAVESDDALAGPGAARHETTAADLSGVEGVQRLAQGEHHVVGNVDHVVDGAHAGLRQARLEPDRRIAHGDAAYDAGAVARAQVGVGDVDRDRLGGRRARLGRLGERRRAERQAGDRRHLASDAVDRLAVGSVGRHFDVEHGLGHGQVVVQEGADRPLRRGHHDPRAGLLETQLLLGEHHAVGLDAAQVRLAQLEAVLERRTGQRDGHRVARREVLGAADDLVHAAADPGPTSTVHSQSLSALGWRSLVSTRPTRNSARLSGSCGAPRHSMPSTSEPLRLSSSASSSTERSQSTYSRNQRTGTLIRTAPRSEGRCRRRPARRARRA